MLFPKRTWRRAVERGLVPSGRDLLLLGYLPVMAFIAALLPEVAWMPLCRLMARVSGYAGARRGENTERIARLLSGQGLGDAPVHIAAGIGAHHHHARLQWLRCWRVRGWRPRVLLSGREHLDAALAEGKGAVLWVAPFVYCNIIGKMTLADAGFRVAHLSGARHGLSTSPFALRWLNPWWTGVEDRFLAQRVLMASAEASGALRHLIRWLQDNQPVTIAVGPHGARRYSAPFFNGSITVANGAVSLARRTGAPLLPVFTVRTDAGTLLTTIAAPHRPPPDVSPLEQEQLLVSHCARLLESHVRRWPDQFDGWVMTEAR